LLAVHHEQFKTELTAARALSATGDSPSSPGADAAELAAWTSIARVLLNLQETITRS
jgi:hypothetical protein